MCAPQWILWDGCEGMQWHCSLARDLESRNPCISLSLWFLEMPENSQTCKRAHTGFSSHSLSHTLESRALWNTWGLLKHANISGNVSKWSYSKLFLLSQGSFVKCFSHFWSSSSKSAPPHSTFGTLQAAFHPLKKKNLWLVIWWYFC